MVKNRGRWVHGARAALYVALIACVVGACASKGYWNGVSTGNSGECVPFNFEITVRDGRITGWAVTEFERWTVSWDVHGEVTADGLVSLETTTEDPRTQQQQLSWTGTAKPFSLSLVEQTSDEVCPTPRSATLKRH